MSEVRAAVIGVGNMGRQHARIYSGMADVSLVGVADTIQSQGEAVAAEFQTRFFPSYQEMLESLQPDLVSVVVPTKMHKDVVLISLVHAKVVLVEKPIALNPDEGEAMAESARKMRRILAVGHIERFNPAVRITKQVLESGDIGTPLKVLFRREGPDPERVRDVNVIEDIGIHDIDLAYFFLHRKPTRINAEGGTWRRERLEDYASVRLAYDGNLGRPVVVDIELSWINKAKLRKIDIVGSEGYLSTDLIRQRVAIFTADLAPVFHEFADFEEYQKLVEDQKFHNLVVPAGEPLQAELAEAVKAARGETAELVTPAEAISALQIAQHATREIRLKNSRL